LRNLSICLASELGFDEKRITENIEPVLKDLAKGYSIALFYEYLLKKQSALLGYENQYQSKGQINNPAQGKINWLGSPLQFVKIIRLLEDRGYIKIDTNKGADIISLMDHFNVVSQRGDVKFNTLRGYFGNPKIKFTSVEADIPKAEMP
jgi:hypothetical protein